MVIVSREKVRAAVLRHYMPDGMAWACAIERAAAELCIPVEAVREALGGVA